MKPCCAASAEIVEQQRDEAWARERQLRAALDLGEAYLAADDRRRNIATPALIESCVYARESFRRALERVRVARETAPPVVGDGEEHW